MELLTTHLDTISIFFARTVLGILFLFQAIDKLFGVGVSQFSKSLNDIDCYKGIPKSFLRFSITISSLIELTSGVMLVLGLFIPIAYSILVLNMILVALAFSINRPVWDMKFYFPRMLLLIFLMIFSDNMDLLSLDNFIK